MFVFIFTSGVFVREFLCTSRNRPRHAGMGLSVSASRGAGDRAGTITRMCPALMFSIATSDRIPDASIRMTSSPAHSSSLFRPHMHFHLHTCWGN